ncbi:RTA1 like protein [Sarocladium strictum]
MAGEWDNLYEYNPSTEAAALFGVLFGISTAWHAFQLFRGRTWYFIPFLLGGLFETIGYVARAISTKVTDTDGHRRLFTIQTVLILLAPALYAASIYMVFGRLARRLDGESHVLIRTKWTTKIFVTGDVISFMTQGAGGGILATADGDKSKSDLGGHLIVGGLCIQLVVFGFYIVVTALFHRRMMKCPTAKAREINVPWTRHIYVLYTVSALIMIRSIFRTIEYIEGRGGHLQTHEVYFYVLDTVLMFFVSVVYNAFHPSAILNGRRKTVNSLGSSDEMELSEGHR